jgi:hypothetical protein
MLDVHPPHDLLHTWKGFLIHADSNAQRLPSASK